jgi:hypothetical protein
MRMGTSQSMRMPSRISLLGSLVISLLISPMASSRVHERLV